MIFIGEALRLRSYSYFYRVPCLHSILISRLIKYILIFFLSAILALGCFCGLKLWSLSLKLEPIKCLTCFVMLLYLN